MGQGESSGTWDRETDPGGRLRRKAEKRLETHPKRLDLEKIYDSEVKEIVHELEIHQIELQMQNEELRHAQRELAESRLKLL